ncbi:cell surface glycoprotein 1-like [Helianthus annuus]|uniref:cell surface glycoprotein 1-like n=1 Tax=Helianthus annuus TaxID=4232 RepID=UPI001652B808|nr:cell surface glycoprotein 1-like [Helianthus annuus]
MSDDDDDFQPFALPDFSEDVPHADGLPDEDPFLIPIPDQDHLILGHPDGEHVVVLILAPLPLAAFPLEDLPFDDLSDDDVDLFIDGPPEDVQGDGVPAEDVIVVPFVEIPIIEHYPSDSDTDTALSAAPTPPHDFEFDLGLDFDPDDQPVDAPADPEMIPADPEPIPADPELVPAPIPTPEPMPAAPEPIPAPEPLPDFDPVPFGIPDVAPLIPHPIPAPADPTAFADQIDPRYAFTYNGWIDDDDDVPPFVEPVTPLHAPAPIDAALFHPIVSDIYRTDLPITFLQDIPPPRPGEGPSSQQPGHDP